MNPDQKTLRSLIAAPELAPLAMGGSPMAQALNTKLLRVDASIGLVELSFDPPVIFTQAAGVVQGGAVAAMLDFALAYVALLMVPEGQSVATASLNVAFVRPAPLGILHAMAHLERAGRSMAFTGAKLTDPRGRVLATASATLPVVTWRG